MSTGKNIAQLQRQQHNHSNGNESNLTKLGRKGDPRMHRAVSARLVNPNMGLFDALLAGGFDFPHDAEHDANATDSDGVTLGQRKNQLSRRLRLARQGDQASTAESSSGAALRRDSSSTSDAGRATGKRVKREAQSAPTTVFTSMSGDEADDADMADDMENINRMAKFHPQFQPLFPTIEMSSGGNFTSMNNGAHASGVAVASLISTASSVGLTLEQLALRLSNTPSLFQALSANPDPDARLNLAVNIYKTDSRALLQKCMLLAGYENSDVVEGSQNYMQVALMSWETEGKRLENLLGCSMESNRSKSTPVATVAAGTDFCECLPATPATVAAVSASQQQPPGGKSVKKQEDRMSGHSHQHHHVDASYGQHLADHECDGGFEGRHVHRLSGKCGHKAIIHQPTGRPAHIDFVVDGKIECYEGIKPVGPKGQGALWPSKHKCAEIACPTDPNKQTLVCGSNSVSCGGSNGVCNASEVADSVHSNIPKQLSLTDVDFDGKEWNVDFFVNEGQDDSIMGLIKLGDVDDPLNE